MNTKVVKVENLVSMYDDLEAALYREYEVHGDNADMDLISAVGHWAVELREAGLLPDGRWSVTTLLLANVGWPID